MNILLIEDDPRVADFVERGLKAEGFGVTVARNGPDGLELALTGEPSLVILDLMLPGMHGHDVCRNLRSRGSAVPVLMLTALAATDELVEGLGVGADDYLGKPFAFEELVARVKALHRRPPVFAAETRQLEVGGLTFDRETLEVRRDGRVIELSAKEMALLSLLMSAPGKVFSRQRILNNVWGMSTDPLTNIVDVYVRKLRRKIESEDEPPLIQTVRGFGYRIATGE